MINGECFVDAICVVLKEIFPNDPEGPYKNTVPEGFKRPCSQVFVQEVQAQREAYDSILCTWTLGVRSFCPVDEYHDTDSALLYRRAMEVAGGVLVRGISVSDSDTGEKRVPLLTMASQQFGLDYCEVYFTAELRLSPEDFVPSETAPLMRELNSEISVAGDS